MKEKADPSKKGHKKKTNHNQIHKRPIPAGREKNRQTVYRWGVSHPLAQSSSAEIREQRSEIRGPGSAVINRDSLAETPEAESEVGRHQKSALAINTNRPFIAILISVL
jgi:hypothetical protein